MIESVSENNIEEVLPLIRLYQEFYETPDINDAKNRDFFSQFNEKNEDGCLFLYRNRDGEAVAFATVYFTYSSTIAQRIGVMNDLYTIPSHRGKGIGRELVVHCHSFAETKGAARLQWLTAEENEPAQKFYASLNAKKSSWKLYTYCT